MPEFDRLPGGRHEMLIVWREGCTPHGPARVENLQQLPGPRRRALHGPLAPSSQDHLPRMTEAARRDRRAVPELPGLPPRMCCVIEASDAISAPDEDPVAAILGDRNRAVSL